MFHLCDCRMISGCRYNVCRRQPPSLHNICNSIFFRKDSTFQLTPYTTFKDYVHAVELGSAHVFQFLPPEFPKVRLWFRYDSFDRKFLRDCPGEGSWHAYISREFSSMEHSNCLKQPPPRQSLNVSELAFSYPYIFSSLGQLETVSMQCLPVVCACVYAVQFLDQQRIINTYCLFCFILLQQNAIDSFQYMVRHLSLYSLYVKLATNPVQCTS